MVKKIAAIVEADLANVESLLDSIPNPNKKALLNMLFYPDIGSQGIFVDDVLDTYITWLVVGKDAPLADDPTKFDNPVAYINGRYARNDPNREKTASGHSLNMQLLLLEMYNTFKDSKIYSHWHIIPAGWSVATANPAVTAATEAEWNTLEYGPIAVGAAPNADAYGNFISHSLGIVTNRTGASLNMRVVSLKDAFRV